MPGTSELIDFRRAFWWLLGGVLLPSIGLVAFGVVAISNERAAVEARLAEEYGGKLRTLGGALQSRLEREADAELEGLRRGARAPAFPLVKQLQELDASAAAGLGLFDAWTLASVTGVSQRLVPTERDGERRTWLVFRSNGSVKAAELDLALLPSRVPEVAREVLSPKESASFRMIALPDRSTPLDSLRRLFAEASAGNRSATVARMPLPSPLDGYLLTAELPGSDPVAAEALRNRTWYIALLALLYTSIGVGFALTLRELYRAAQLSRLKTDFVANISHELRTPLTSVRLFAETLQSGRASTPAEVQECLDLLATEAERLSVLVEKLLDWSRLESGGRVLQRESIEVEALLEQVGVIFRAQQLGATYAVEVERGLPQLSVDRAAMVQVILNLLHNAVKYTGDDKKIELRARRAGRRVAIEVQDNGPGVRPHERKRIFERFYRADDLLSRRTEGTGLGLAIAKRIVEGHGGTIEVDSREGEGSTFRVLLRAEPPPQLGAAALPAVPGFSSGRKT